MIIYQRIILNTVFVCLYILVYILLSRHIAKIRNLYLLSMPDKEALKNTSGQVCKFITLILQFLITLTFYGVLQLSVFGITDSDVESRSGQIFQLILQFQFGLVIFGISYQLRTALNVNRVDERKKSFLNGGHNQTLESEGLDVVLPLSESMKIKRLYRPQSVSIQSDGDNNGSLFIKSSLSDLASPVATSLIKKSKTSYIGASKISSSIEEETMYISDKPADQSE